MNVPPIGIETLVQAIIAKSPPPDLPISDSLHGRFFEITDLDRELTREDLSRREIRPMRRHHIVHFVTMFHTLLRTSAAQRIADLPTLWQTHIQPLFTETTLSLSITNLPAKTEASPYHYVVFADPSGIRLVEQRDIKRDWNISFSGDTLAATFNGQPCDSQFVAELIDKFDPCVAPPPSPSQEGIYFY